jgi:hypothetical protein
VPLPVAELTDILVPAARGSLMRVAELHEVGLFRISRRDAELYSVQITSAGAWGRIRVWNGTGRILWRMPSTFAGSFWLGAGADEGLVVSLESMTQAPMLTVNFRELDLELV